ncbi:hypothetical protein M0R45_035756 [Rubus argutus]|uniref:Uncharacterized protein n=1 Tax=Rubus argutus TaxID=59490 RepID=A0AAW1VU20_RUBAR
MEEAKLVQAAPTQVPNSPSSVEAPPSLPPKTKKRPLNSDAHISNSTYFKIRAVLMFLSVDDLNFYFIFVILKVLRTTDFQKCKAANEIEEQVKLLMDLYKQMTAETLSTPKCNDGPEGQLLSGAKPQDTSVFARPSEYKFPSGISGEKQQAEDGQIEGPYVVGGSAFGWNFITFSSMELVFYGMTKEFFRAQAVKLTTL